MTDVSKAAKASGSILLIGFLGLYLTDFITGYGLASVHPMVLLPLMGTALFAAAGFWLQKYKKAYTALCFIVLFLLYSCRVWPDNFTSYLWCEDGIEMISDAIFKGASSVFDASYGSCWVIPRFISFVCYRICLLFGDITHLPQLQALVTKMLAAGCLMYFMSDRFEWLAKERAWRFVICAMVVLAIPGSAYDALACDTSVPFVLNFTVFLIGLDTLLGPVRRPVSIGETVFLTIQAVSTAAAPFCGAVAVFACLRWLFVKPEKDRSVRSVVTGIVCTLVVSGATLFQLLTTLMSSREVSELLLGRRLLVCTQDFVFFPYLTSYENVLLWILGLAGWVIIVLLAKLSWKLIAYCAAYGYAFLFYCSMTGEPDQITEVIETGIGARYYMMNYMIAFLLLGVCINLLFASDRVRKLDGAVLLLVVLVIAYPTYLIDMPNVESAFSYDYCSELFDTEGDSILIIPIAPDAHFRMVIPFKLAKYEPSGCEAQGAVETVNGQPVNDTIYFVNGQSDVLITGHACDKNGEPFEYVFFDWGEGQWVCPVTAEDDAYVFCVDNGLIRGGSVSLIGISADGERYDWSAGFDIVVQ